MNPKISIIVPVYNSESYLKNCVGSILSQTISDLELLLIDDGSTDESGRICDDFAKKDERVKTFHQNNQGPSVARNLGLRYASGDIISFVDSDDWIESNYCDSIINGIRDVEAIFFPIRQYHEDESISITYLPEGMYHGRDNIEQVLDQLHNSKNGDVFGWTVNKAYRRDVIFSEGAHFPIGINYFEDEVFSLQCFRNLKSIRIISNVIYNYRYVNGGLTIREHSSDSLVSVAKLFEKNLKGYRDQSFLANFCGQIYNFYFEAERKEPVFVHKVSLFLNLRNFYRNNKKKLNKIHLNKKRHFLYSMPRLVAIILYLIIVIQNNHTT